jgi:hypothetical protein
MLYAVSLTEITRLYGLLTQNMINVDQQRFYCASVIVVNE